MALSDSLLALERDLRSIFGLRMRSLVAYGSAEPGEGQPTLAVVDGITADDLRACADRVGSWHDAALATPLILGVHEFSRSLDAFPYEFGAILSNHQVIAGQDPFEGLTVDRADVRRACEVQARSHLLHLREGYIETRGRSDVLAALVDRSAAPLATLLASLSRLHGHPADRAGAAVEIERLLNVPAGSFGDVMAQPMSSEQARRIFPAYLDAVERLVHHVDNLK